MGDDTSNRGARDRSRVSRSEGYEVRYFAEKHGISVDQVHELIREHGNNREVLDREAERLK